MEVDTFASQRHVAVQHASDVGEARRAAAALAREVGFPELRRGQIEIVVTELATNALKHGNGGHIFLVPWREESSLAIDVIAVDSGPGISDIVKSMGDGYSTAGSPGNGLGAVSRLAHSFDIYSKPMGGTAILARFQSLATSPARRFEPAAIAVPVKGEVVCGDAYAVHQEKDRCLVVVADGLGHGPIAAEAAMGAIEIFKKYYGEHPSEIIARMHSALRVTRGAAIAVAEIDLTLGILQYCGVGNIAGVIVAGGKSRSLVSHNGTVGHQFPRVAEFNYPWTDDSILIMHSDGLSARWDLEKYPGATRKSPALIAALLYRDSSRGRDDATVLSLRQTPRI